MEKSPDYTLEKPFTEEQLSEIRRNFTLLSTASLQQAYSEALKRCRLGQTAGHQKRNISRSWCRRGGSCGREGKRGPRAMNGLELRRTKLDGVLETALMKILTLSDLPPNPWQ
jgi:hypothetical protein